jgi:hypothetical protein
MADTQKLNFELIDNAITFLRHPKVRGSSEESKRSFLVSKGLTSTEIDEAFRRVEQDSSFVSTPESSQIAQNQHVVTPDISSPTMIRAKSSYSVTNVILGAGFAAAALYSVKKILGPSLHRAMSSWRSSEASRGDGGVDDAVAEGRDKVMADTNLLIEAVRDQTDQLRASMEKLIQSSSLGNESVSLLREEVRNLALKLESTASQKEEDTAPLSYMQVLEMLEQGRTIPGIRDDINDKPPNPDLSPTSSRMDRMAKPWERDEPGLGVELTNSSTTPNRRDLSGQRPPNSIYESVTKTPDKHRAVVVEQSEEGGASPAWRPPPLPSTSMG